MTRSPLFRWVVFGAAACVCLYFAYGEIMIDLRTVRTVAQVRSVSYVRPPSADVTFSVGDRRVDTTVLFGLFSDGDPSQGDQILVEYSGWDPQRARLAGNHDLLLIVMPILFAGLVLLVFWAVYERRAPRFVIRLWHRKFPPRGRRAKT